jgi:succinoglycan biosynthesis transport protein ExoP
VHGDPVVAASVANSLAALLVEQAETERRRLEEASPARVEARLAEARERMEQAEDAIRRFRESASAHPTSGSLMAPRLDQIDREKDAVSHDLLAARGRADQLRQAMEIQPLPGAAPAGVPSELEQLRAELSELRERYTEEHPDVRALLRRIRELEATTSSPKEVDPDPRLAAQETDLRAVEREIEGLQERDRKLDAERTRLLHEARNESRPEPGLETLVAEYDRAQASYLALLDERQRVEIATRTQAPLPRLEVLEWAKAPERPYFPDRRVFGLGGLVLGLALGLGLALIAEARDHSVKGPEDLQEVLPQPLLATIPFLGARGSRERP